MLYYSNYGILKYMERPETCRAQRHEESLGEFLSGVNATPLWSSEATRKHGETRRKTESGNANAACGYLVTGSDLEGCWMFPWPTYAQHRSMLEPSYTPCMPDPSISSAQSTQSDVSLCRLSGSFSESLSLSVSASVSASVSERVDSKPIILLLWLLECPGITSDSRALRSVHWSCQGSSRPYKFNSMLHCCGGSN